MPENNATQFYEMAIVFSVDVSDHTLNGLLTILHESKPVIQNCFEITIKQTVAFVPTDETLAQYAEVIKSNLKLSDDMDVENVRFVRYDYLRPVSIPDSETDTPDIP